MSAPPSILNKVRLLRNLAQSANPNEAENARVMAEKLIEKHNITEAELKSLDPKEYYGEDEKLFVTIGLVPWKQQLAVAVAKYFDCQIVQEEYMRADGEGVHQYHHYVYGDDDQVKDTQFIFHAFLKKIENLIDTRCVMRGDIYIASYCEGIVESVKWNIDMYGIDLPQIRKPLKKEEKSMAVPTNGIVKSGDNKEEPTDRKIDINKGQIIRDIMAYFKGVDDGKNLSLQDIIELEAENRVAEQIESQNDDHKQSN